MRRFLLLLPALLLAVPATLATDDPKSPPKAEKAGSPQEQFDALKREYETATKEMQAALDTYRQRMQTVQSTGKRLLDYAEKNPKDPAAADALVLLATNNSDFQSRQKAIALIVASQLDSDKIGGICVAILQLQDGEKHVRGIIEKNMHHQVQGQARLALAGFLKQRLSRPRPGDDKDALAKEAEILLNEVVAKYADVKAGDATLADAAKTQLASLHALANLVPGKAVPEIEGPDLDGKDFKLSDYRGKVVMLDFWGHW